MSNRELLNRRSAPKEVHRGAACAAPAKSIELGLTLIELMTVVSVIAVLAAMSLPFLSRGGMVARSARCKSNIRELLFATRMYVDDQGVYPMFVQWNGPQPTFWPDLLASAVSESLAAQEITNPHSTVFACPAFRNRGGEQATTHVSYGYNGVSFAFRGLGANYVADARGLREIPVAESEVVAPSQTILIGDGIERHQSGILTGAGISIKRWVITLPEGSTKEELELLDGWIRSRHRNRANVGFCDGHVESNTLRVLFDDTTDEALRRWNRDHEPHRDWLIR